MSICFAAITPHPPVLIPNIGKEKLSDLAHTQKAMKELEESLYLCKPDLIIVISPHSALFADSFSINSNTHFVSQFQKFGDLTTNPTWQGDTNFATKINHCAKKKHIPITIVSDETLDHGSTVPLYYLTEHLKETKILPIGYSNLAGPDHIAFGKLIKEIIMEGNKKVAVIASGDLAHGANVEDSLAQKFDETIMQALADKDIESLLELESKSKDLEECGYRSILILMGILKNINYRLTINSYEHPYGVGYLTAHFSI